jgi:hypothetical protein
MSRSVLLFLATALFARALVFGRCDPVAAVLLANGNER